jgi:hypothetical protein
MISTYKYTQNDQYLQIPNSSEWSVLTNTTSESIKNLQMSTPESSVLKQIPHSEWSVLFKYHLRMISKFLTNTTVNVLTNTTLRMISTYKYHSEWSVLTNTTQNDCTHVPTPEWLGYAKYLTQNDQYLQIPLHRSVFTNTTQNHQYYKYHSECDSTYKFTQTISTYKYHSEWSVLTNTTQNHQYYKYHSEWWSVPTNTTLEWSVPYKYHSEWYLQIPPEWSVLQIPLRMTSTYKCTTPHQYLQIPLPEWSVRTNTTVDQYFLQIPLRMISTTNTTQNDQCYNNSEWSVLLTNTT